MEEKKEHNIKLIRLISGEDIVADITINENSMTLTNPISIAVVGGGNGKQPQAVAQPYLIFSTENYVEISNKFIVYTTEPVQVFFDEWKRIFDPSPIITSTKNVVVPDIKIASK